MKARFKEALRRKVVNSAIAVTMLAGTVFAPILPSVASAEEVTTNPVVELRILETTDIHTNILNYDYFQDVPTEKFGLSKAATLIKQQKAEATNSLLFDNGDLIQGNPLGDYVARVTGLEEGEVHPAIKALNLLEYDAATVGNHEFNFGLDFLNEALDDAVYPVVSANVYHLDGVTPYFDQYELLERTVTDTNGNTHEIQVGVTGFVPPQILNWDYGHLNGKVTVKDIMESANEIIPQMKAEGADVIVVLAHSGIDTAPYVSGMENAAFHLTTVEGVDAVLTGHSHSNFPALPGKTPAYPDSASINNAKGTINGVPVTMPGSWGDHIGQIDLDLEQVNGEWTVVDSQGVILPTAAYASDTALEQAVATEHAATVEYVNNPVGTTTAPINSYFALVQDDPSVQIVNNAQKWYVEKWIAGAGSEYAGIPVLSSAAPFKAGGRDGSDASYFTDIAAGTIAIKNVADLYLYPNTVYALKINGSELKEWIEWSSAQFNQIDPNKTEEQPLINYSFRSYNFDVIDGVTYEIDVTQPAKYDGGQNLINANASRVKNLEYNGQPVTADMEFIVATNNYRAGTNKIINPGGKNTILVAPDENRQAIIDYIVHTGEINPSADGNWKFAQIDADVNVTFLSSAKAIEYLGGQTRISYPSDLSGAIAKYSLNLGEDNLWPLRVLHTNDTHAHLDDVARRVTLTEQKRGEVTNSLLLDAGDVFSGDLYFTQWFGQADLEFMNMMGYDAMVPGNHEFDKGPEVLADFISGATFPIVSSNIDFTNEPALSDLLYEPALFSVTDEKTIDNAGIYPYIIIDVNGEEVGVIGLTTEDTPEASSPGENIIFNNIIESAAETVELLEAENVNKIIALSHQGYNKDMDLAKAVEGIDLIVGGHTHTSLEREVVVFADEQDVTPTIVVQANDYGEFLGQLDVAFDPNGVVSLPYTFGKLVPVEGVEEDPEAKELLDILKAELNELKTEVVGNSEVLLDGARPNVRSKETNLGNLIADGMLAKAKTTLKGADIALTNGGGIRASIDVGEITLGEVLTTMPFGNTLAVLDVTGAQVIEALENGVSGVHLADLPGKFPHVSGMKFTYDVTKPAGERILSVEVLGENGQYAPIELNKTYRLATNAFVAAGGDGYDVFKEATYMEDLGIVDFEVFLEHIERLGGTVNPQVEGRIVQVTGGTDPGTDPVEPTPPTKVEVKPVVKNGTAVIDTKVIEALTENSTLVVNLTTEVAFNVQFTSEQIAMLKEKGIPVVVKNNDVEVHIPVANFPEGDVLVHVKRMADMKEAVSPVYDFKITVGGTEYHEFEEDMTLVFKVDASKVKSAANVKVLYYNEKTKKWEVVGGEYKDGVITAKTNHFSTFAAFEVASDKDVEKINKPKEGYKLPNTATNSYNLLFLGLMAITIGGLTLFLQRRRVRQA